MLRVEPHFQTNHPNHEGTDENVFSEIYHSLLQVGYCTMLRAKFARIIRPENITAYLRAMGKCARCLRFFLPPPPLLFSRSLILFIFFRCAGFFKVSRAEIIATRVFFFGEIVDGVFFLFFFTEIDSQKSPVHL